MKQIGIILSAILILAACANEQDQTEIKPATGKWRAYVVTPGGQLPFNLSFDVKEHEPLMAIYNASDTLRVTEIRMDKDSIFIDLPVYHASIYARLWSDSMSGQFLNFYRGPDYRMPFHAKAGADYRFFPADAHITGVPSVAGRWEVWFDPESDDPTQKIGLFEQTGNRVTGAFLSPTGDTRYLEGAVDRDSFYLSTFDGMFVYLYKANIGDTLRGMYWSGNHYEVPWIAWRNDTIQLPDPGSLASVDGSQPFTVNLTDRQGNPIGLTEPPYAGKPVIIQIGGTWCPNCKDEGKVLADLYNRYHDQGLEILSLSFERARDTAQALKNIDRILDYFDLPYPVYYAGFGNTEQVQTVLPQLTSFRAYPSSIFVKPNGEVIYVHTGFSGPASGDAYTREVELYEELVKRLMGEEG